MTNNTLKRALLTMELEQERKWSFDNAALLLMAGWRWLLSTVFWAFAGYGYRPSRCIFWSIFMIMIGGWIFSGLYENGNMIHLTQSEMHLPNFYPTAYAADLFIPLIDLRQASDWVLIERPDEPFRPMLLFYWGYSFLGWVFAAIFGASVTGLVRK